MSRALPSPGSSRAGTRYAGSGGNQRRPVKRARSAGGVRGSVCTPGAGSVRASAMRRDERVSLCVDDERPPYAFVVVEGRARLSDDLEAMLPLATAIGRRYMGSERADEFGRRNAVPGELLVRVSPTRVLTDADVTG